MAKPVQRLQPKVISFPITARAKVNPGIGPPGMARPPARVAL